MAGRIVTGQLSGTANAQTEEKEKMREPQSYHKTYKPLVLWMIVFLAASTRIIEFIQSEEKTAGVS